MPKSGRGHEADPDYYHEEGRQAGYFIDLRVSDQMQNTSGDGVRDQFSFRVALSGNNLQVAQKRIERNYFGRQAETDLQRQSAQFGCNKICKTVHSWRHLSALTA